MDLWKTTKNALLALNKYSYESLKIILEVKKKFVKVTSPNSQYFIFIITYEWKGINRKQSTRWQHLSRLKASAFFSLQIFVVVMKRSNLYLGLVLPSGG